MIVPLAGLFLACAIFASIGAALLALIPRLRVSLANVALFVIGAVPSCAVTAVAYGGIFGDATGDLHPLAVLGLFGALLISGVCGGLLAVVAYRWHVRSRCLKQDSGK